VGESAPAASRLAEEFAYRLHDPGDVSKLKTLGWLEGKYAFSDAVAVRAAVRGWYDAVFDATDRYPPTSSATRRPTSRCARRCSPSATATST